MLRGMNMRLSTGHQVGSDFWEVGNDFVGLNANLVQLRALLNGWGDGEEDGDEVLGKAEADVTLVQSEPVVEGPRELKREEEVRVVRHFLRIFGEVPE